MYNISPIQAGIQSLHAAIEYSLKYGKNKEYIDWAKKHKTVVILNGGTSNDGKKSIYGIPAQFGSMENHYLALKSNKVKCAAFYEPDLNNAMSAIAFLVDERVFNKTEYPDYVPITIEEVSKDMYSADHEQFDNAYKKILFHEKKEYIKKVGKYVAFLKDFLKPFKLAQN